MLCSGSDAKFWQHLPAVLLIHISAINREDVYPENNKGGTDEIYASDPEQSIWEMNPIYTYSGCPWIALDNSKESRL